MSFTAATVLALLSVVVCGLGAKPIASPVLTDDFVNDLNSANLPWKASKHQGALIEGATEDEVKQLLGVRKNPKAALPRRTYGAQVGTVPASFDAATQWSNCPTITHIRDQSACGSCWAVAAAEAISDRYCTYGVNSDLLISALDILACCTACGAGCNGGDPASAWSYWQTNGLVSDACEPYPFPMCEHHIPQNHYPPCPSESYPTPKCPSHCTYNNASKTKYFGNNTWSLSGVPDFQHELMTNGPFEVTFNVYKDFLAYKGGVYVQHSNDYLGGHAVKVVGWGVLNGVDYWKIANSWNTDWGLDGYFLIRRGTDECGIEDSGSAGSPQP